MRDHRPDLDPDAPKQRDITEQVHQHHTKHPGSVRRSDKNKARQAAKRAQGIASGLAAASAQTLRMALELATAELHDLRTENMRLRHQARETAAIHDRLAAELVTVQGSVDRLLAQCARQRALLVDLRACPTTIAVPRLIATSDDGHSWPFVVEVPRATWDALHAIGGES